MRILLCIGVSWWLLEAESCQLGVGISSQLGFKPNGKLSTRWHATISRTKNSWSLCERLNLFYLQFPISKIGIIVFYCPQGCCKGKYRVFRWIGQESHKNTRERNNFHSKSVKQTLSEDKSVLVRLLEILFSYYTQIWVYN